MKWNLRWVAAQRDIWRPVQLQRAFAEVGFTPSLSKVAALWGGTPVSVRLDDLDKICAALNCTVDELLRPEPVAAALPEQQSLRAVGDDSPAAEAPQPKPRLMRSSGRLLPPN
jgi:DNA-binding Xre family transcriptional regulator